MDVVGFIIGRMLELVIDDVITNPFFPHNRGICFALSGLVMLVDVLPRAMPWAVMCRPFGARGHRTIPCWRSPACDWGYAPNASNHQKSCDLKCPYLTTNNPSQTNQAPKEATHDSPGQNDKCSEQSTCKLPECRPGFVAVHRHL